MRNPWIGQDEQSLTLLCPYPYSFPQTEPQCIPTHCGFVVDRPVA